MSSMVNLHIQDSPELISWTQEAKKDIRNVKSKDLINRLPLMLNKGLTSHNDKNNKEAYILLTRYLHIADQLQKRNLDTQLKRELHAALKVNFIKTMLHVY